MGVKIGRKVFTELYRVNPPDLHKLDLLHNIYLGLFKHMMEWVEGFLKKHKRQQAFDNAWKEIPPYISKNTSLRPGRPVRQTHLAHRTSIANQDAPGAHLILRTHRAHP